MKQFLKNHGKLVQWALGIAVIAVSFAVWADVRLDGSSGITVYTLFPLFGLIAFSLMWTHYAMGAIRRMTQSKDKGKNSYWYVSSTVVLACLLLHPLLLSFGLWRDGLGLPPFSYMSAYESMQLAVLLGSLSLTIFLAFELYRWFGDRPWWRFVEGLQFIAMLAVFIHALSLGGEFRVGWFGIVWWFYGITLIAAHVYSYRYDRKRGTHGTQVE